MYYIAFFKRDTSTSAKVASAFNSTGSLTLNSQEQEMTIKKNM
jgi:hypothetical protein